MAHRETHNHEGTERKTGLKYPEGKQGDETQQGVITPEESKVKQN